jgi:hypothetical protein
MDVAVIKDPKTNKAHCEKEVEKCMEFVLQYLRSTRPTTGQSVKDTNKYGSWE